MRVRITTDTTLPGTLIVEAETAQEVLLYVILPMDHL